MTAYHPDAEWDPIPGRGGLTMVGGTAKGIAHSTEGGSYAGARSAYVNRGVPPHFTIEGHRLIQHIRCDRGSYAMGNSSGGVETNRGGSHVVQVELVGHAGRGFPAATLATFNQLRAWLHQTCGIPDLWPVGRPPKDSRSVPPASAASWVHAAGWFAHCQVPEQEGRWDPGFTDADWAAVIAGATFAPASTPEPPDEEDPMAAKMRQFVTPAGPGNNPPAKVWGVSGCFRVHIKSDDMRNLMIARGILAPEQEVAGNHWDLDNLADVTPSD